MKKYVCPLWSSSDNVDCTEFCVFYSDEYGECLLRLVFTVGFTWLFRRLLEEGLPDGGEAVATLE